MDGNPHEAQPAYCTGAVHESSRYCRILLWNVLNVFFNMDGIFCRATNSDDDPLVDNESGELQCVALG